MKYFRMRSLFNGITHTRITTTKSVEQGKTMNMIRNQIMASMTTTMIVLHSYIENDVDCAQFSSTQPLIQAFHFSSLLFFFNLIQFFFLHSVVLLLSKSSLPSMSTSQSTTRLSFVMISCAENTITIDERNLFSKCVHQLRYIHCSMCVAYFIIVVFFSNFIWSSCET